MLTLTGCRVPTRCSVSRVSLRLIPLIIVHLIKSSVQPTIQQTIQPVTLPDELINGLRIVTLMDKTEEVLRSKFHQYFPTDPKDLYKEISSHKMTLTMLRRKGQITMHQYEILLPVTGRTDSLTFDITLLTLVLRVLCPIHPPVTGWAKPPLISDHSESAYFVRIRIERNIILHHGFKYNNKEYEDVWNRLASALVALGCNEQELLVLKSAFPQPELQPNHQNKLKDSKKDLQCAVDLEDSLDGVTYNMVSSVPSFVGREQELLEIRQELSEKGEDQIALVIHGLGGVGKSELARQYCQLYATSDYKQNVIWINAENKNSMMEDFFNVAERIKLKTTDESDKQLSIKTVVYEVYRFFADQPVLFVFDNAINKSDLMEFMEINPSTKVSVLITSQFTEWGERFIPMRIDVLSKEEAFGLISQNLDQKHTLNDENTLSLCEKVQYLPLALQQAIAYIKRWSITVTEYLEQFERQFDKVMKKPHGDEKYNKTIMTTWDMALQKLKEENNSSLAITLINTMSYLDGKNIKKELFYKQYDKYTVNESLELLQNYSLITITTSDDDIEQTIIMHSLLQYVIRKETDFNYFYRFLDMILTEPIDKIELSTERYREYWYRHLVYMFGEKGCLNLLTSQNFEQILQVTSIFKSKGKISILHQILHIFIDKFQIDTAGCQNQQTFLTQQHIAYCLQQMGYYDEALTKFTEIEKLHPDSLTTQQNIADCLREMNKFDKALVKYRTVRQMQIDTLGPKHIETINTQEKIASCIKELYSEYVSIGQLP